MHADLKGALEQINKAYKAFEHKGQRMSKEQVRKVLVYGISKGYKTTAELSDDEVDKVLNLTTFARQPAEAEVLKSVCGWCGEKRKLNDNESCKCCVCLDDEQTVL